MYKDRCDIILPTCGQTGLIRDCIESLIARTRYPFRLIAIDDGKSPEASKLLEDFHASGRLDMVLIKPKENLGWVRAINRGLEDSKDSKYISFQNDDTVFTEGWLEELVDIFEKDNKIGIANPEWEIPDGADIVKFAADLKKYKGRAVDTDYCRGHCFVVRREVVNLLGGFDPVYIPVYYDDRDYSLKAIKAGYRCVKAMGSFVAHVRNATMTKTMDRSKITALMERNGRIFYKRWGYPLRLVFILHEPCDSKQLLQNVCMDQNKVIVIVPGKTEVPYEHTNMKVFKFGRFMFNLKTLVFLLTKRSKKQQKGIDFVFTDAKKTYSFLGLFRSLMPAQLVLGSDAREIGTIAAKLIKEKKNKDKELIK
ncbi:MAG: glycosyltransferase [Candidatus Omnitrophica bacterium]|nr:glycosyltransferase [Candidatus Omnitrophota bacterium]